MAQTKDRGSTAAIGFKGSIAEIYTVGRNRVAIGTNLLGEMVFRQEFSFQSKCWQ